MKTVHCPHCGEKINVGSLLAGLGKGVHRQFTPEQLLAAKARLAAGLAKRWAGHVKVSEK